MSPGLTYCFNAQFSDLSLADPELLRMKALVTRRMHATEPHLYTILCCFLQVKKPQRETRTPAVFQLHPSAKLIPGAE